MTLHSTSSSLRVMSEAWQVQYLRHVEAVTGWTLSAIAEEAGISSTTLTRPVNNPSHKYQVKLATLEAVQRVTGIPFVPFQPGSGLAEPPLTDAELLARFHRLSVESHPLLRRFLVALVTQGSEGTPRAGSAGPDPGPESPP